MTTLDVPDTPKMIRETLCIAQATIRARVSLRCDEHSKLLQRLIEECDRHRPIGADGTHGDRHTPTCGCQETDRG